MVEVPAVVEVVAGRMVVLLEVLEEFEEVEPGAGGDDEAAQAAPVSERATRTATTAGWRLRTRQ